MAILLAFAFISGIVTILSPCILPVLPIVLSGGVGGGKARPLGVVAGFVSSFTFFTLALSAIVQALGIPADALRFVAVALIGLFGLVMLVPRFALVFERLASRLANLGRRQPAAAPSGAPSAPASAGVAWSGFGSGVVVGLGLGLVWTPCVGPIMASVISLALSQHVDGGSVFITLAYTIGTALPMFAVMIGGRALINRVPGLVKRTAGIQRGFGALLLVVAVAIGFGWDRKFQTAVLAAFPNYGSGLTALETTTPVRSALKTRVSAVGGVPTQTVMSSPAGAFTGASEPSQGGVLSDLGTAPELVAGGSWFNSPSLTMTALRGKVVLVDFWTYSCVNCLRTLPYLKAWNEAYASKGLVIIGVHSPEFAFEKVSANVQKAVRDLGVTWPVVQDNDYKEWNAYSNNYWPAHYFIDARGHVRYVHYGEGEYDTSEKVIQALLAEAGHSVGGTVSVAPPDIQAQTPETYLGYARGTGFASAVVPIGDKVLDYKPARVPGNAEWNLDGRWLISGEYVFPEGEGVLALGFHAKNVYLVVAPHGEGGSIRVQIDGKTGGDTPDVKGGMVRPNESRLYQLVALPESGEHVLRLTVSGGIRLYAFTFG